MTHSMDESTFFPQNQFEYPNQVVECLDQLFNSPKSESISEDTHKTEPIIDFDFTIKCRRIFKQTPIALLNRIDFRIN